MEKGTEKKIIDPYNYRAYTKQLERVARKAGVANILGLLNLLKYHYILVLAGNVLFGYEVIKECYVSIGVTRNDIELFNSKNQGYYFKQSQKPRSENELVFNKIKKNCKNRLLRFTQESIAEKKPVSSLLIQHMKENHPDFYNQYIEEVGFSKEEIEEFRVIERGATFS